MTSPHEGHPVANAEEPEDEASPRTKWLCESALKRLEATQRDFDTINARTGVVIGFSGLFNSLLLQTWGKLPKDWKFPTGLGLICTAGFMLFFAFLSYKVTNIQNMPLLKATRESYYNLSDEEARDQFTSDCIDAADRNDRTNNRKARHLNFAIFALAVQIFLSIIVVICAGLPKTS